MHKASTERARKDKPIIEANQTFVNNFFNDFTIKAYIHPGEHSSDLVRFHDDLSLHLNLDPTENEARMIINNKHVGVLNQNIQHGLCYHTNKVICGYL